MSRQVLAEVGVSDEGYVTPALAGGLVWSLEGSGLRIPCSPAAPPEPKLANSLNPLDVCAKIMAGSASRLV